MNKRIASIDALRGITIIMMIFCAAFGWNSGLPAWMFHCQCPPPTYAFDPTVKGITWVDLVFPWFLFAMGAAIPFSLGGKLRKGIGMGRVSLDLLKRWLTLAAFGLVLGNAGLITDYSAWGPSLLRLGIWCGLFLALWRVPSGSKIPGWTVNIAGVIAIIALLVVEKFAFGVSLSLHSNDIIIMVLSLVALVGGFAWLITREKPVWRLALLVVVAALKEVSWQAPGTLGMMNFPHWIDWLLNWRYLQYLVVVLLGTFAGDILAKAASSGADLCANPTGAGSACAALLCLLSVPAALVGFFTRNIWVLLAVIAAFAAVSLVLTRRDRSAWALIIRIGYACLLLGIIFDPIDGGITKDHCNLSYMLSAGGLACLMSSFLLWCESRAALRGRTLSKTLTMTGQNPMVAYTVTWFVILPLLSACGFGHFMAATVGSPVLGLLQGVILTGLMVVVTCLLTRARIFWRS